MRVFQGAGKFQQVIRVVRWIDSAIQHGIIASAFALASELCARKPHERMKPINGASQLGENLRQPIVTRNVRELVGKNGPSAFRGPVHRSGGKQNAGTDKSPGQRHGRWIGRQENLHGTRNTEPLALA